MNEALLVQDLAIILIIAAVISFIFKRLNQPLVVGYIIAGIIIGPYTPPFSYLSEPEAVGALAEIGVILLLFGIGLTFPLSKLVSLGRVSIIVATLEIGLMIAFSLVTGWLLGWPIINSIFLGAALASSSTAIIAKCMYDLRLLEEPSCDIMLGVLIVEDLAVVLMLATLQSFAAVGSLPIGELIILAGKIIVFLGGSLLVGWRLVIPFIENVRRESNEILVITAVGVCFAFSIVAYLLGFSVAIGAFIAGVIIAGWKGADKLIEETLPLREIFGAIFFVSVGALMDVTSFGDFIVPALIITLTMLGGKFIGCSLGTRISGYSWTTAVRVGLGMAQIGEFAFIVIKAGNDLGVLTVPLYSMVGFVTVLTTFMTPYMIKLGQNIHIAGDKA
ncbi:TPA: cation:proton antiporter [Candidatus Bathyarchaeota archaeon]|nr:cation:proton antiporter [Candidatus Bathyarchaeota archaeon]